MKFHHLLAVGLFAALANATLANPIHPSFLPSPPPAIRVGNVTTKGYNPVAASFRSTGLTPGRAYVMALLDDNGNQTDIDMVVTVGPDLLDPKGNGVTLDFWNASVMNTVDDPAIHLGQAFFKIDKSGITFYGWKEGVNPVIRPQMITLFPKGVSITSKAKMGVEKTTFCTSKNGYGNPGSTAVTTNQGVLDNSNLVAFLWQTAETEGIQIIVTPGIGLVGLWLNGYYFVVIN